MVHNNSSIIDYKSGRKSILGHIRKGLRLIIFRKLSH